MKKYAMFYATIIVLLLSSYPVASQEVLVEAESFDVKGGWVVDPQFVEQMGSPYLMAHGMGKPVANAMTRIEFEVKGQYHVWVRSKNWAPGNWEAPGRFQIKINDSLLQKTLGVTPGWGWEKAGKIDISKDEVKVELIDLTGFNGRADAVYFSMIDNPPPSSSEQLLGWRNTVLKKPAAPNKIEGYDLVVVGGGIAGCAASVAAAEQGLKVALIHDRPVLGGNASSEIRVHTLGIYGNFERILKNLDTEHYPNGFPAAKLDQEKRDNYMKSIENIDLYLNWRAFDAKTAENTIKYVDARHTSTGEEIRFEAPLFVDSTGDGWIGYWAGAEFFYGRESVNKYGEEWEKWGELWSPEEADDAVMGSSVLWRSNIAPIPTSFPDVPWALPVTKGHAAENGEWYWEFSRNDLHQIHDAEAIRDHMLKAIYGSFANAKKKKENKNLELEWVSYLVGKRESRRLVGDYVYTFNDVKEAKKFPDAVVMEEREVDVHYQQVLVDEEKPDFLSKALFYKTERYYIPYRSFYSKNIDNLYMAGRNFSASHIGLGGPRVMRTTGQMGAAVGFAAALCNKYNINPREVYTDHLEEYMNLIESQKQENFPSEKFKK